MDKRYKNLGKVCLTPQGDWIRTNSYERLDIVTNRTTNASYIAKQDVPEDTDINDERYWQIIGTGDCKNGGVLFVSTVNPSTGELVEHDLTTAINAVKEQDRHPGVIIAFYGVNTASDEPNDKCWFLYQYDAVDNSHFLDIDYWVSLYDNVNKFKGYFQTESDLKNAHPSPQIGDYAYVGNSLEDAILYACKTPKKWENTNTKAIIFANLYEALNSRDFSELEYNIDEQYCDRAEKDALGRIIHFTYITREGLTEYVITELQKAIQEIQLPNGCINLENLSESLKQYIGSNGNVVNMPDEEDLTVKSLNRSNGVISFKDKKYSPNNFSGLGRKYLRKNIVDGINVLEQYMINEPNTIYIIQYDYCLNGAKIEVPENCVLHFEGGTLNGGSINLNSTKLSNITVLEDIGTATITNTSIYKIGQCVFDTILNKPVWWDGSKWIEACNSNNNNNNNNNLTYCNGTNDYWKLAATCNRASNEVNVADDNFMILKVYSYEYSAITRCYIPKVYIISMIAGSMTDIGGSLYEFVISTVDGNTDDSIAINFDIKAVFNDLYNKIKFYIRGCEVAIEKITPWVEIKNIVEDPSSNAIAITHLGAWRP